MYVYILLAIVILILYFTNVSSVIVEEFDGEIKKEDIELKSANDPKKASNKKNRKSKRKVVDLSADNAKKIEQLTKEVNQLKQQQIVLDKARNPEYATPKPVKINDQYKLLVKDQPEINMRKNADSASGYNHMRPDVKDPYKTDGYSYISPALWNLRVWSPRPPVCLPAKGQEAEVQPIPTTGTPLEALAWEENLPRFTYNEVYDPKYYGPGYEASY